ncbi:pfs domain-containing protein [Colletotrichum salicis]|uniref:Pfs domain-containing protein n=1 Tax=Colletotrichum salicis TaxID=1209931 RepID=A0A135U3F1_9PEZI|nr:pfs domain-containing protein [Colletotrichum salicis]
MLQSLETSLEGAYEAEILRRYINEMVAEGVVEGLNMKDERARTLLHLATRHQLEKAARYLIRNGADLEVRDYRGSTPLLEACWQENVEIVDLLLASPWELGLKDNEGMTPLHAAAFAGDGAMVWDLREKGADPSMLNDDGWTPLMTAIVCRQEEAVIQLLRLRVGEDPQLETRDSGGQAPLMRAVENGFWDGVRLLAEAGAVWTESGNPETVENDGSSALSKKDTALQYAISGNHARFVTILLFKQGANLNAAVENGRRSLHLASLQGNKEIMEILLKNGKCDHFDLGDDDNMTPLHLLGLQEDTGLQHSSFKNNSQHMVPQIRRGQKIGLRSSGRLMRERPAPSGYLSPALHRAREVSGPDPENQEPSHTDDTKENTKSTNARQVVLDIINNPPTGLICSDSSAYSSPRCEDGVSSDNHSATIIQFHKAPGCSTASSGLKLSKPPPHLHPRANEDHEESVEEVERVGDVVSEGAEGRRRLFTKTAHFHGVEGGTAIHLDSFAYNQHKVPELQRKKQKRKSSLEIEESTTNDISVDKKLEPQDKSEQAGRLRYAIELDQQRKNHQELL